MIEESLHKIQQRMADAMAGARIRRYLLRLQKIIL